MTFNTDKLNFVKKLVVIGLVSDDELMETLVLKGGNAMILAYGIGTRGSLDLDFSMESDFEEIEQVKYRIEQALVRVFSENEYHLFDFDFRLKPKNINVAVQDFWGGYSIEFKVISEIDYKKNSGNIDALRRNAIPLDPNNSPKFSIDISKYEYTQDKKEMDLDGYRYYVYSLEMIILEKLRAICQQLPEYSDIIKSKTQRGRARDFYDIYTILEYFGINIQTEHFKELLELIFEAKKVPLDYINKIYTNKDLHEKDFETVKATVSATERGQLKEFNFYFDYVVRTFMRF
jgi:predicted nucleotidyltransferase component of viral defense system